jgi:hypothetical protein
MVRKIGNPFSMEVTVVVNGDCSEGLADVDREDWVVWSFYVSSLVDDSGWLKGLGSREVDVRLGLS